ncbi:MAG TPA: DUF192 domain-containing protein [Mycobacteriales bacterium]|nr:DUF192 domain-containing protein [Mycobacteriales bacterium]
MSAVRSTTTARARDREGRTSVVVVATVATVAAVIGGVAGCDDAAPDPPASTGIGQRIEQTVRAELDGVPLTLEVADEPQERRVGLMGRDDVPRGTGMVFEYEEPTTSTFHMFQVPVPLTAVFIRDGVVVHVAQMTPCTDRPFEQCPQYGPGEPFDTVVETAPETLPGVAPGDRYVRR